MHAAAQNANIHSVFKLFPKQFTVGVLNATGGGGGGGGGGGSLPTSTEKKIRC